MSASKRLILIDAVQIAAYSQIGTFIVSPANVWQHLLIVLNSGFTHRYIYYYIYIYISTFSVTRRRLILILELPLKHRTAFG